MKIDSYQVSSQAQSSYVSIESVTTNITTTTLNKAPEPAKTAQPANQAANANANSDPYGVQLDLSDNVWVLTREGQKQNQSLCELSQKIKGTAAKGDVAEDPMELRIKMLESMISSLTGKKFRFRRSAALEKYLGQQQNAQPPIKAQEPSSIRTTEINTEYFKYESEQMTYQSRGLINTSDGRTIAVDVNLSMSRASATYLKSSIKTTAVDPLVINYAGTAASLTGEKFDFDLDFDGKMDKISFAGEGSGFLALDRNGDGVINDGSELFGPGTGSGFGELHAYDFDGNSWIDENDAIFSQLRIWTKDKDGNDHLFTLKELDIGAIYLGDVKTQFSLNDAAENIQGVMRSTSFFLKESGGAGTISHIDLAI